MTRKDLFRMCLFGRVTTTNLQHQVKRATLASQDFVFLVCIQYLMLRLDLRPKRNTHSKISLAPNLQSGIQNLLKAVHDLYKKTRLRC